MAEIDGLLLGEIATGFFVPSQEEVRAWNADGFRALFGDNQPTASGTVNGHLIDFLTRAHYLVMLGLKEGRDAAIFKYAPGKSLEEVLALVGFPRELATASAVRLAVWGAESTLIGAGEQVSTSDEQDVKFATDAAMTTDGPEPRGLTVIEVQSSAIAQTFIVDFGLGPSIYVAGAAETTQTVAEGWRTQIGIDYPSEVDTLLLGTDPITGYSQIFVLPGTLATFTTTLSGSGVTAKFAGAIADGTATATGPKSAFATTIRDVDSPVPGWEGVSNPFDAVLGRDDELDEPYRDRWRQQRDGKGDGTPAKIKVELEIMGTRPGDDRESLLAVRVYNNPLPIAPNNNVSKPNAFRAVVARTSPGATEPTDIEIATVLQENRAAGTDSDGFVSVTLSDQNGDDELLFFDLAIDHFIWVRVTITRGELWSDLGDPEAEVAESVASAGDDLFTIGTDVERFQLTPAINVRQGVKSATIELGFTLNEGDPQPPLLFADLVIDPDELPRFDSSRVLVTVLP